MRRLTVTVGVVLVLTAAGSTSAEPGGRDGQKQAPRFEHPEDARAPKWKDELFCSDGESPGIDWLASVCGKSAAACAANLDRQRVVLTGMMGPETTFKPCAQPNREEMQRVYCFKDKDDFVCSGKQMFCEALHEHSTAPASVKGRGCKKYRLL